MVSVRRAGVSDHHIQSRKESSFGRVIKRAGRTQESGGTVWNVPDGVRAGHSAADKKLMCCWGIL